MWAGLPEDVAVAVVGAALQPGVLLRLAQHGSLGDFHAQQNTLGEAAAAADVATLGLPLGCAQNSRVPWRLCH